MFYLLFRVYLHFRLNKYLSNRWDFPNGWPPLQHMLVVGLENTGDPRAKALAFDLAQKWLINNYDAYQQSMPNAMFEKVSLGSSLI